MLAAICLETQSMPCFGMHSGKYSSGNSRSDVRDEKYETISPGNVKDLTKQQSTRDDVSTKLYRVLYCSGNSRRVPGGPAHRITE